MQEINKRAVGGHFRPLHCTINFITATTFPGPNFLPYCLITNVNERHRAVISVSFGLRSDDVSVPQVINSKRYITFMPPNAGFMVSTDRFSYPIGFGRISK